VEAAIPTKLSGSMRASHGSAQKNANLLDVHSVSSPKAMNDVHYSSVHHVFAVSLFAVRKTETIKDLDETNF
jgi:hypothetical protein